MQQNQQFSIDFHFPVHFTRAVFSLENATFLNTVCRLEPEKRHRVLFIVDSNVATKHPGLISEMKSYVDAFPGSLQLAGAPVVVQGGEVTKNNWGNVYELLAVFNRHAMDRQSAIAIVGGGAVLDMACFAAAIAHRSIRTIRIPTTVVAQGDSGVGV